MAFHKIVARYQRGENAIDLMVEKWLRIRESLEKTFTLSNFKEILDAVSIKVPLCLQYKDNCALCPVWTACGKGHEGSFGQFRLTALRGISSQNPWCLA